MNKKSHLIIALIVIILGSYSCAPALSDFVSLVPENAYGFVRIDNSSSFFTSIDKGLEKAALNDRLAPEGIRAIFFESIKQFTTLEASEIDPLLPLGMSFSPSTGLEFEPILSIYLPLKDANKSYQRIAAYIAEQVKEDKKVSSYLVNSYCVITYGLESALAAPKKSFALGKDYVFPKDELLVYVPIKENLEANALIWSSFSQEFLNGIIESSLPESDMVTEEAITTLTGRLVSWIESIDFTAIRIRARDDGLELSSDISFLNESKIAEFLKTVKAGSITKTDADYLNSDNLLSYFLSFDPSLVKSSIIQIAEFLSFTDEADNKSFIELIDKFLSVMGSKQVYGLSYQADFEKAISESDIGDPSKLFDIGFSIQSEIKDEKLFDQFILDLPTNLFVQKTLDALSSELGQTVNLSIKDQSFEGLPYKNIGLEIVSNTTGRSSRRASEYQIGASLKDFSFNYVLKSKQVFVVFGTKNLSQLKDFVDGKVPSNSLASKQSFQEYLNLLPSGTQTMARINFAPLLASALKAFGINYPALSEKDLGIMVYGHINQNIVSSSYYYSWKELGDLVPILMQTYGF